MKAIVAPKYGSAFLRVQEVAKPVPRDNEVLVEVHAASVNAADVHLLSGKPFFIRLMGFGLLRPRNAILGAAVAGRVAAVGSMTREFRPGDEVFGDLFRCGFGGLAEFVCAREDALALKPRGLSFEEAAAVPMAAVTALQGLRDKGHVHAGQKVLVYGASGGVGTFAVQIARSFGAEVTAVCSTGNVDTMRSLGADHVIDYTKEDFVQSGKHYDLIIAANGNRSISDYRRALGPNGAYVMIGGSARQMSQAMFLGPLMSLRGTRKMGSLMAKPSKRDLVFLRGLLEAGEVVPVIDRRYPLAEGVEALRYLENGHAKGKVVVRVEH